MKNITIGITAHVDSGKTTLAEAVLYHSGAIRRIGRVDNGNSFLDTDSIERDRGITIFSSQAELEYGDTRMTLLDTPGHADFLAEAERTMQVLDYAILVISGTDGVQSHTSVLWKLLMRYGVPVFIFVNKMDLTCADRSSILEKLRRQLSDRCADFTNASDICENSAECDEELMEAYLAGCDIPDSDIVRAIAGRRLFPCMFGSALKQQGIAEFMDTLDRFTAEPERYGDFGARVCKISYDSKGTRLTHLKVLGGELKVRSEIGYMTHEGEELTGKISSVRFYSGEKFRTAEKAVSGDVCAVTGLEGTYAGQGLGCIKANGKAVSEPVMTYRVNVPDDKNVFDVLRDLRRLEDTDPQLHVVWNEQLREIRIRLMGAIQTEILTRIIREKHGYEVSFDSGSVAYRETIAQAVEGVGHYEPLRHYAEVHLLLEPLPRNSGLEFCTAVSEDVLDRNRQRLVLTHLEEKPHLGVLTGSPIADMRITLVSGRAHIKHTEGGDFRQATYRAVRQGLRSTESILLEPYYDYEIEVPTEFTSRVIADLQRLSAEFSSPETLGETSVIRGSAPVSEINGYQETLTGFTHGKGRIAFMSGGYRECHNAEEVIAAVGYDCDADVENSADSIFCSHGAGMNVKWDEVPEYMHLPYSFKAEDTGGTAEESKPEARTPQRATASEEELMAIFEQTYGKIDREPQKKFKSAKVVKDYSKPVKLPDYIPPDYLLVDGYNIIFAWEELKKSPKKTLKPRVWS